MKIAYVVVKNIRRGGGIEKYTEELGKRLARAGHEITVYSMRNYGESISSHEGMSIQYVPCCPMKTLEKGTAAFFAMLKALKKKPDIVHFHTIPAGAWLGFATRMGMKCLLQWHGLEWKRSRFGGLNSKIALYLEKYVMGQQACLTAVSRTQCDYFERIYNKKVHYIPTGTDIKPSPSPSKITAIGLEPRKYLFFASRLVREKGAHYLIPAFRHLDTDFRLVLAGDSKDEEAYKQQLRQLAGNDKRIIFTGFVQGRLLEELFAHTYAYIQPSEVEGLSIALLEAMSYGSPCLVSDIPENLEAISDIGWYFRNTEVESLSERLRWMIDHPKILDVIREKSRNRVRDYYSWDKITEDFESLYMQMLQKDST